MPTGEEVVVVAVKEELIAFGFQTRGARVSLSSAITAEPRPVETGHTWLCTMFALPSVFLFRPSTAIGSYSIEQVGIGVVGVLQS